jgi:hypothetical protein
MRSKIGKGEFKRFFKVLKTLFIMGKTNGYWDAMHPNIEKGWTGGLLALS